MEVNKMIAYVQLYIHARKNKEVNIEIRSERDYFLLVKAYRIAITWMNKNNFKIIDN